MELHFLPISNIQTVAGIYSFLKLPHIVFVCI